MISKILILGLVLLTSFPVFGMKEDLVREPSTVTSARLFVTHYETSDTISPLRNQRANRCQIVQDGLLFLGCSLLTVTSTACYTPEYPVTSTMMISGWSALTLGTGLKLWQTLQGRPFGS